MFPLLPEDSEPAPLGAPEMVTDIDFNRLEKKVDRLAEALNNLVRIEERQTNQGTKMVEVEARLSVLERRTDELDRKVDRQINWGMGVWAAVVTLWAAFQFFESHGFIRVGS